MAAVREDIIIALEDAVRGLAIVYELSCVLNPVEFLGLWRERQRGSVFGDIELRGTLSACQVEDGGKGTRPGKPDASESVRASLRPSKARGCLSKSGYRRPGSLNWQFALTQGPHVLVRLPKRPDPAACYAEPGHRPVAKVSERYTEGRRCRTCRSDETGMPFVADRKTSPKAHFGGFPAACRARNMDFRYCLGEG